MMKKTEEGSRKKMEAAMTVEASLVLPVFIILFVNLLSAIEVYRIHSNVAATLWEEGRGAAKYYYLEKAAGNVLEGLDEMDVSKFMGLTVSLSGRGKVIKNLESYPIWERIVGGGKSGFLVSGRVKENGDISIDCSYRIHPLFAAFTPVSKQVENHYYGHSWIGYVPGRGAEGEDETYVYITETGTVYHRNRGCSYLNPSIRNVRVGELESIRNKGGAIYYACPLCGGMAAGGIYYITGYGTSYHTSILCTGLKRTIYEVKLNEAGGRGACSKCGG